MNFMEVELLDFPSKLRPLVNSAQLGATDANGDTGQAGRPRKDSTELTDSGEQSREDGVDDGDWG